MRFGTVRCYDCQVGFGWIKPNDGGHEVAVNESSVKSAGLGQLAAGQILGFQVGAGQRGPVAINLWATWSNR